MCIRDSRRYFRASNAIVIELDRQLCRWIYCETCRRHAGHVSPNNAAVIRDRLPAGVFCDRRDRIRGSFGAGFGFVVLAIEQKVASNMGIGIGLRVVEDEGVLTMPWSATETYRRLLGEWPEHVLSLIHI